MSPGIEGALPVENSGRREVIPIPDRQMTVCTAILVEILSFAVLQILVASLSNLGARTVEKLLMKTKTVMFECKASLAWNLPECSAVVGAVHLQDVALWDAGMGNLPEIVLVSTHQFEKVFSLVKQDNLTVLTRYWSVSPVDLDRRLNKIVELDTLVVALEEQ